MQFFDIRQVAKTERERPSVQVTDKQVVIRIPSAIAQRCGLLGAKAATLQFGRDGERQAIRAVADDGAMWKVQARKNLLLIYCRELRPKQTLAMTEVEFDASADGLVLHLPQAWELVTPHVVSDQAAPQPAARPARRPPPAKAA